jgi:hypothetical protein
MDNSALTLNKDRAMNRIFCMTLLFLFHPGLSAGESDGKHSNSVAEALANGSAGLTFRYRLETVDQSGIINSATASTLKTRLNYRSGSYEGVSLFIEADDVTYLGDDDFNNLRNGLTNYPVVADPDGTHINQAYIDFKGEGISGRLGRQRIILDNQRFIGGVGWRQNEQTYDALSLNWHNDDVNVMYTYVDRVSRIFGPDSGTPDAYLNARTHLLNVSLQNLVPGKLSVYYYGIEATDAAAVSSATLGARYTGTVQAAMDGVTVPFTVEYATQDDYGNNPASFSVNYWLAEAQVRTGNLHFGGGFEALQGDRRSGQAFSTPLATLHAFQGWADKFLTTPAGGIEDFYVHAGYRSGPHTVQVAYHVFDAEAIQMDYGSEWDLSWGYKINSNYSVLAKYAAYQSDGFATDTNKFWLMATAAF